MQSCTHAQENLKGLPLSRLRGPEALHKQEVKARAGAAPPLGQNTGHPGRPALEVWDSIASLQVGYKGRGESSVPHSQSRTRAGNRSLHQTASKITLVPDAAPAPGRTESTAADQARRRSAGLSWPDLRTQPISRDRKGSPLCFWEESETDWGGALQSAAQTDKAAHGGTRYPAGRWRSLDSSPANAASSDNVNNRNYSWWKNIYFLSQDIPFKKCCLHMEKN